MNTTAEKTEEEVLPPRADEDFYPEEDDPGSGDPDPNYDPNTWRFVTPPTIGDFMLDNSFVRLIMGPVGSGKSAGCFMELLRRARLQQPDREGIV